MTGFCRSNFPGMTHSGHFLFNVRGLSLKIRHGLHGPGHSAYDVHDGCHHGCNGDPKADDPDTSVPRRNMTHEQYGQKNDDNGKEPFFQGLDTMSFQPFRQFKSGINEELVHTKGNDDQHNAKQGQINDLGHADGEICRHLFKYKSPPGEMGYNLEQARETEDDDNHRGEKQGRYSEFHDKTRGPIHNSQDGSLIQAFDPIDTGRAGIGHMVSTSLDYVVFRNSGTV